MALPSDPPADVTGSSFKTWAQNVSDSVQDHDTRVDALESATSTYATLEELTAGSLINTGISSTSSYPIWTAPFACTIEAAELVNWNSDIAVSDTDYWTIRVARYRDNVYAPIASKTTQATGGEAIDRRSGWNFDGVTFSETNKVLQKGDNVGLVFEKTGSATALSVVRLTIRYEPA